MEVQNNRPRENPWVFLLPNVIGPASPGGRVLTAQDISGPVGLSEDNVPGSLAAARYSDEPMALNLSIKGGTTSLRNPSWRLSAHSHGPRRTPPSRPPQGGHQSPLAKLTFQPGPGPLP